MADHLGTIFGTEQDRVNCPIFDQVGACRHGDACVCLHYTPPYSQTVLIPKMWTAPHMDILGVFSGDEKMLQIDFDYFYMDVLNDIFKYGRVEEFHVCRNIGDHLLGNVYIKFTDEEGASKCLQALHGRFFACKLLLPEFSPVTDFRKARCRQFEEGTCNRGGMCDFMHIMKPSKRIYSELCLTEDGIFSRQLTEDWHTNWQLMRTKLDNRLRHILDPREQLPRELNFGASGMQMHGIVASCKLTRDELRQLMIRLHSAPQDHVIRLSLPGHQMDDGMMQEMAVIAEFNKALQFIDLSSNHIGPSGMLILAGALSRLSALHGLNLNGNHIGDSGCSALAGALPHLSALQQLHLSGNYSIYMFF